MRLSTGLISLLLPALAIAQNYQGMSESDMQNMMQQMQEMQTCMENIDQPRLKAFEQQASKLESEVKSLCANGKRDAAQQKTMAFAQEMSSNPDIQKMMECGEKMRGMMPTMPYMDKTKASDTDGGHVCD